MKKFLVLYLTPVSVLDDWKKTDPATRKAAEEKMQGEWKAWMGKHAAMLTETAAAGKTKLVNTKGVSDIRNDVMLYAVAEGESHEAVAKAFEDHPHMGIPQASIEIMEINPLHGM